MSKNDVHDIAGRIKNIIAMEGIALSPVGTVLVNYYTLALKRLYDFSEKLPITHAADLKRELAQIENVPMLVIKVANPEDKYESLYERVMRTRANPRFGSNKEALDHFIKEYEDLGQQYEMSGDELWLLAEESDGTSPDQRRIMELRRSIQMCQHLLERENK